MKEDTKYLMLRVPEHFHQEIRLATAKRNTSIQTFVISALLEKLSREGDEQDWQEYATTYSNGTKEHEALNLPWDKVEEILGREHDGHGEDDWVLVLHLRALGAPRWVLGAEGFVDENGWLLIGPEIEED